MVGRLGQHLSGSRSRADGGGRRQPLHAVKRGLTTKGLYQQKDRRAGEAAGLRACR
jgi:hypothetical protein